MVVLLSFGRRIELISRFVLPRRLHVFLSPDKLVDLIVRVPAVLGDGVAVVLEISSLFSSLINRISYIFGWDPAFSFLFPFFLALSNLLLL